MSVFGDVENLLADLYPYRWPITIALVLLAAAAVAAAYRAGWHRLVWRHRLASGGLFVLFLAAAIPLGDYLLSPLWERSTICEASPIAGAGAGSEKCEDAGGALVMDDRGTDGMQPGPASSPSASPTPAFEPQVTREGEFRGADDFHFGRGKALLIETAPGQYTLRFEEFSVRNGPDLFVYLSPDPGGYADEALNLGGLKGTDGAFNYEVPPGTDVSQFQSALVWCRQFSVLFAVAPLPAGGGP